MKKILARISIILRRTVFPSAFICIILLLSFLIRIQDVERIPEGQFTGADPYLYAKQSEQIVKLGYLPARDMDRWVPFGRDNRQLFPLYPYVLAYTYKTIGPLFPKLTLYHIHLYSPPVFFTFGLVALSLFLLRIYGVAFTGIVVMLLAVMPGSINRSLAGFSDRDAWIWLLAVLTITTYLWKERMQPGWRRYLMTVLTGFIIFLGGLSWEVFGLFVAIILCVEIWKFCSTDTEQHLKEYLLWFSMFAPSLFLLSPAYRSGYGFSKHVAALMLFPSLIVLGIRSARHLLLHFFKWLRPHAKLLALGLLLVGIAIGIWYVLSQSHTFALTASPLHKNRLMQHVSELVLPYLNDWQSQYGGIFILGSLGLIFGSLQYWGWKGFPLAVYLSFFVGATFFREPVSIWIGDFWTDTVFASSIFLTVHEALSFLKTHNITHIMLTDQEVAFRAKDNSFIGSDKTNDRHFKFHKLKKIDRPIGTAIRLVPEVQAIPLTFIDIAAQTPEKVTVTANFRARRPLSHEFVPNADRETKKAIDVEIGGIILYFHRKRRLKNVYYVPPIGWNSIAVKLFM